MFTRVQGLCNDIWPSTTAIMSRSGGGSDGDGSASTRQLILSRIKAYLNSHTSVAAGPGHHGHSPHARSTQPFTFSATDTKQQSSATTKKKVVVVDRRSKPMFGSVKLVERITLKALERLSSKTRRSENVVTVFLLQFKYFANRIEWTCASVKACSTKLLISTVDNLRRDGLFIAYSQSGAGGSNAGDPDGYGESKADAGTGTGGQQGSRSSLQMKKSSVKGSARMNSLASGGGIGSLAMELELLEDELKVSHI